MFPSISLCNRIQRTGRYAVFSRLIHLCITLPQRIAYGTHLFLRQARNADRCAFGLSITEYLVGDVVCLCSKLKVVWVYTMWRITCVSHHSLFRYPSSRKIFQRKPVSHVRCSTDANNTITSVQHRAAPEPTALRCIDCDATHEPFQCARLVVLPRTCRCAKSLARSTSPAPPNPHDKLLTASRTGRFQRGVWCTPSVTRRAAGTTVASSSKWQKATSRKKRRTAIGAVNLEVWFHATSIAYEPISLPPRTAVRAYGLLT